MAEYGILADMSRLLLEIVRHAVCPALLPAREMVSMAAPDQRSEALLNLYLYDLQEFSHYIPQRRIPLRGQPREAPLAVTLRYLLYLSRHAQTPADALTEHRVLGRALQALRETGPLDPAGFSETAGNGDEPVALVFSKLDVRCKQELWNAFSQPLRPAVYFEAGPLLIDGPVIRVERVRETETEVGRA